MFFSNCSKNDFIVLLSKVGSNLGSHISNFYVSLVFFKSKPAMLTYAILNILISTLKSKEKELKLILIIYLFNPFYTNHDDVNLRISISIKVILFSY